MTIAPNSTKWSIDDYHRMIDAGILDDKRVELLNGEIIDMTPEGIPHSSSSDEAAEYLRGRLAGRAKVREAKPVTLPNQSEPQPDIAIVELPVERYRSHHPYPENIYLLIEYSYSSLAIDTEVKRRIYATAGIREYWIVNLKAMKLILYRDPVDGDYQSISTLTSGEIEWLAFPGTAIAVDQLLRR